MPAEAGIQGFIEAGRWSLWIPACAGMTVRKGRRDDDQEEARRNPPVVMPANTGIQGFIEAGRW